jgi:hypothetical protein
MNEARTIARITHWFSDGFAALLTGSRTIPLGDNGELLRDLALRTERSAPAARESSYAVVATDR